MVVGSVIYLAPGLLYFLSGFTRIAALERLFFSTTFQTIILPLGFASPIAFAYAIARHRVFDVRIIIRQGLQYAMARDRAAVRRPDSVREFRSELERALQ